MTRNIERFILQGASGNVHDVLYKMESCSQDEIDTIIDICQSRKMRAICESQGCFESEWSSSCKRCGELF